MRKIEPCPTDAAMVRGAFSLPPCVYLTAYSPLLPPSPALLLLHPVHCKNNCGVIYVTTPKGTQGWETALTRLNSHESKRCSGREAQTKPLRKKKVRKMVSSKTVVGEVSVHCCNNCGIVYKTVSRGVSKVEWNQTLRRLNSHESQRCSKREVAEARPAKLEVTRV